DRRLFGIDDGSGVLSEDLKRVGKISGNGHLVRNFEQQLSETSLRRSGGRSRSFFVRVHSLLSISGEDGLPSVAVRLARAGVGAGGPALSVRVGPLAIRVGHATP